MSKKGLCVLLLIILLFTMPLRCLALDAKPVDRRTDAVIELILLLKSKGIITEEEAKKFIARCQGKAERTATGTNIKTEKEKNEHVIIVVSEEEEKRARSKEGYKGKKAYSRIEEQIKEINRKMDLSSWTQRIKLGGDIRLRYQGDFFDDNNALLAKPSKPDETMNTRKDRHRLRYRVRFGVTANVLDGSDKKLGKLEAGFRLVTTNDHSPISTEHTMGDYYNNDNFLVERGYLKWSNDLPKIFGNTNVTLWGGKFENPFFSTNLVWDRDLNFEGVAMKVKNDISGDKRWGTFLTLGAFPLQEVELSSHDKWLYGGQIGMQYADPKAFSGTLGIALYDYKNIKGVRNDPGRPGERDWTAPAYQQKGNTLMDIDPTVNVKTALAADFRELNITGILDCGYWSPIHVTLIADYVRNIGYDKGDVSKRTGNKDPGKEVNGFMTGIKVGHHEVDEFGEWNFYTYYKYLEADAAIDAFTDSDFHLGGTNAKGWLIGTQLGVLKNSWLELRWITSDEIKGPPLAIDSLFVDLNTKF